jgi:hypothetical protein
MDGSNFSAAVAAKTQWTATLTNFGIHLFVRLLCKRTPQDTHDLTAKLAADDRPPRDFSATITLTEVAFSSGSSASPTGASVRAAARTRTGS